jgi:hypothetical protein
MELESNAATATSETTVDLRAPLPLRAISRFELEASMITRGPEGIHPVSMTMAATIQAAEVGRR